MANPRSAEPTEEQLWAVANYLACRDALQRIFHAGLGVLMVLLGGLLAMQVLPGAPISTTLLWPLSTLVVVVALLIVVQTARQTWQVHLARQQALRAGISAELLKAAEARQWR